MATLRKNDNEHSNNAFHYNKYVQNCLLVGVFVCFRTDKWKTCSTLLQGVRVLICVIQELYQCGFRKVKAVASWVKYLCLSWQRLTNQVTCSHELCQEFGCPYAVILVFKSNLLQQYVTGSSRMSRKSVATCCWFQILLTYVPSIKLI